MSSSIQAASAVILWRFLGISIKIEKNHLGVMVRRWVLYSQTDILWLIWNKKKTKMAENWLLSLKTSKFSSTETKSSTSGSQTSSSLSLYYHASCNLVCFYVYIWIELQKWAPFPLLPLHLWMSQHLTYVPIFITWLLRLQHDYIIQILGNTSIIYISRCLCIFCCKAYIRKQSCDIATYFARC